MGSNLNMELWRIWNCWQQQQQQRLRVAPQKNINHNKTHTKKSGFFWTQKSPKLSHVPVTVMEERKRSVWACGQPRQQSPLCEG